MDLPSAPFHEVGLSHAAVALAAIATGYYILQKTAKEPKYPLPPSLKALPIIGNTLDMPTKYLGHTFFEWGKRLNSNIISATAPGQVLIILNSIDIATELVDKRSAISSSRAKWVMGQELLGFDYLMIMLPYNDKWKERRKLFVTHFRPGDAAIIRPQEEEFVGRLLLELNKTPDDFAKVIQGSIGGFVMSLAYGIPVQAQDDPYVAFSDYVTHLLAEVSAPGASMVDTFPALKYLPSWFPGAGFKRFAASVRHLSEDFRTKPYNEALQYLRTPNAKPSFLSTALEQVKETGTEAEKQKAVIKDTAAMFYAAGVDTVVASILNWIWIMMKHPALLARVHDEIDTVLGGRLPSYDDQDILPFLTATLMESTRWAPVTPIGVPHQVTEDSIFNGYLIPKNSIIIPNMIAMFRNEVDYRNPEVYNPDRFYSNGKIRTDIRNPLDYAFGFGRRVCPGAHIGKSMVWLVAANLASVYTWSEPEHGDRRPIRDREHFEPGMLNIRSKEAQAHLGDLANASM